MVRDMASKSSSQDQLALFSIFFTFFVDNLTWSIVFPIFAPYFLDPHNHLFSPGFSAAARSCILALFIAAFSLGQFLGAPWIGECADRFGRKKALLLSVFFTWVGLAISAWSMGKGALGWLFLGRLFTGIFASNLALCLACVSDLSPDEKTKAKHFGTLSVIAGLSFIIGAFLGGKLSDPTISSHFTPQLPLWLATGLTVINWFFILFGFRETFFVPADVRFDFWESFRHIQEALQTEKIKKIYLIYFCFLFSWTILFQFMPVLMVERFTFTNSNLADLALYMGLFWAMGSGYLNQRLLPHFSAMRILEFCLFIFPFLCLGVAFTHHLIKVLLLLAGCVLVGGLAWPLCTVVISNAASKQSQGKILGLSQSVQSLAMTVAPLIGGIAFEISWTFPFVLGALASFCAGVLYLALKEQ